MRLVNLQNESQSISNELSKGPVVIRGHLPDYLRLFLDNCIILSEDSEIIDFCIKMDSLKEINEQKVILNPKNTIVRRIISSRFSDFIFGFPNLTFLEALNSLERNKSESFFFSKFPLLKEFIVLQSRLSNIIVDQVKKNLPDVVILFMIDGLSAVDFTTYLENRSLSDAQICNVLVDTATITSCAFRNLIYGETNTPISIRLHKLGYTPSGFSYWNRKDELLTDELFYGVIPCRKVSSFNEVVSFLRDSLSKDGKLYFQVLREGLDSLAHRKREIPNIEGEIDLIMEDISYIKDIILEKGRRGLIFCCSDHGILWETTELELHRRKGQNKEIHERYFTIKTSDTISENVQKNFIRFPCGDNYIYCARFPFTLKHPKSNSCGVHGGVSIEESLVPFIQMEVK